MHFKMFSSETGNTEYLNRNVQSFIDKHELEGCKVVDKKIDVVYCSGLFPYISVAVWMEDETNI